MNVELLCAGLLALLLFGLGFAVSIERGIAGKLGGVPDDEKTRLFRLIRAHGNAAEYAPAAIAFALYFSATPRSTITQWLVIGITAARYIHAFALIMGADMGRFSLLRFVGGMGTYVTGVGLALTAIIAAT